jgi:hypothetical protein
MIIEVTIDELKELLSLCKPGEKKMSMDELVGTLPAKCFLNPVNPKEIISPISTYRSIDEKETVPAE